LLAAGAEVHIPCFAPQELESCTFADHSAVHIDHPIDLTDPSAVEGYYAALPPLWASIQIAGGFAMAPIADTAPESFSHLMALNVTTCFLCCRAALASIRRREGGPDGGRLVNVAARPALEPRLGGGMVAYTTSKAAVAALSVSLGEELAEEGVWVNAVAPSIIDTPANRHAMPTADHSAWAAVEDIAETMVFLASPANRSTRSGVLPVYGRS
jgi:NAD(P)-dependent dehydrogenase (short-subunit alcohol dehydrogenase family)